MPDLQGKVALVTGASPWATTVPPETATPTCPVVQLPVSPVTTTLVYCPDESWAAVT